jgi:hypothetical protein
MPTIYLYVKQHLVTGLLYFGKTTCKDPFKYNGSGVYWTRHRRVHGYSGEFIKTLEVWGFDDQTLCTNFALNFSEVNDIVNAKDEFGNKLWANLIPENGLDGTPKGVPYSKERIERRPAPKSGPDHHFYGTKRPEHSAKLKGMRTGEDNHMFGKKAWNNGIPLSPEAKLNLSIKLTGYKHTPESSLKKSNSARGIPKSEEWKEKNRKPKPAGFGKKCSERLKGIPQPKAECPHCQQVGSVSNMKRWHFDNCKHSKLG